MSLDDIVKVTIDLQTASVSRVGFGTPLIMSTEAATDSRFTETAKIYTQLSELTTDGFIASGVTFLKAQSVFSQNPKVSQLVIGKRSNAPTMVVTLTPTLPSPLAITTYAVTIGGTIAAETFAFVTDATPTGDEIVIGLIALINAGNQNVVATGTTTLILTAAATPGGSPAAGNPFTVSYDELQFDSQNTTPDPGLAADLAAIQGNVDGNDDWYQVYLDSYGSDEILALAGLIETQKKTFLATTSDSDVLLSPITDVGGVLQAADRFRTALIWHKDPHTGPDSGWGGGQLPTDPGSITWAFKSISGVIPSVLTPTQDTNLKNKNVNRYTTVNSNNITLDGKMAGGEFIDVVRGIDFITARLQEAVFAELVNLPKIPFTDLGIAIVENAVKGVLQLGVSQDIFAADPEPVVTVPLKADVSTTDVANRLLPDVNFTATLAGAIHAVEIAGVVTV